MSLVTIRKTAKYGITPATEEAEVGRLWVQG